MPMTRKILARVQVRQDVTLLMISVIMSKITVKISNIKIISIRVWHISKKMSKISNFFGEGLLTNGLPKTCTEDKELNQCKSL